MAQGSEGVKAAGQRGPEKPGSSPIAPLPAQDCPHETQNPPPPPCSRSAEQGVRNGGPELGHWPEAALPGGHGGEGMRECLEALGRRCMPGAQSL